jgi:hypothetical protein
MGHTRSIQLSDQSFKRTAYSLFVGIFGRIKGRVS